MSKVYTKQTTKHKNDKPLECMQAQEAAVVELVSSAAQRLAAAQATPAAAGRNSAQPEAAGRGTSGSAGASSDADLVTPPGGFQAGQVWLNNVFSPEMPPERPRCAPCTSQKAMDVSIRSCGVPDRAMLPWRTGRVRASGATCMYVRICHNACPSNNWLHGSFS